MEPEPEPEPESAPTQPWNVPWTQWRKGTDDQGLGSTGHGLFQGLTESSTVSSG